MRKIKPFVLERNFLILMTGVFVNSVGSGIYLIAGMLLVLELSGNVLYSGFAMFAISTAGVLGFSIAPLANYTKYKNGLIFSNLIKALMLFTIPVIHYTVGLDVWYVIILLFLSSLFTQYTYPIESTILPIIVGQENVIEGNSYLQTIREAMDIIFIASAGIIVMLVGSVQAIMITSLCIFLVSLIYVFFNFEQPVFSKEKDKEVKGATKKYVKDLKGGFGYIKDTLIPKMIVSVIFLNLAMAVMTTNMPAFALIKGNGNESAYGFYLAAISLGIMIGTIITPKIKHWDFGKLIIFSYAGTGILWLGSAFLPIIPSILLFCIGAVSIGILNILIFSSIQKQVETEYIGRVITVVTSIASLGIPLGSLIGGMLGESYNPVVSVIVASVGMISFSLYWLSSSVLRRLPNIDKANILEKTGEKQTF